MVIATVSFVLRKQADEGTLVSTIAGAVGLVGLMASPPELESKEAAIANVDYWGSKRTRGSLGQEIVLNLGWLLMLAGFGWLSMFFSAFGCGPWVKPDGWKVIMPASMWSRLKKLPAW